MEVTITIKVKDSDTENLQISELKEIVLDANQEVLEYCRRFDQATTTIADRINQLLQNSGNQLNEESRGELTRIAGALEQLGHDPNADPNTIARS